MDGFRAVAYIENGICRLVSRKDNVYKSFAPLCAAIGTELRVENAILDGEIVCLDGQGRSVFNELLFRHGNPCFCAFDLLSLNGEDLRELPLLERKKRLRRVIGKRKSGHLLYTEHTVGSGTDLFRLVCANDLEGIVAKRKDGLYSPSTKWIKIKNPQYSQAEGRRELFEGRRSGQVSVREARGQS